MINVISSLLNSDGELAITPTRNFNLLYIIIDSIFLVVLLSLLIWKKKYLTVFFALFGGVLYVLVDYCGFYLASGSRTILIDGILQGPLNTFWVLLWMSLSYGITNFTFMWVLMAKDEYRKYWIFLIVMWWMIAPSISELGGEATIQTSRTTGAYHGWMGVFLVVAYVIMVIVFMRQKKPVADILRLVLIGCAVQFCWEFALLANGIRPMNAASIRTLIVNSALETNLGIPGCFLIYYFVTKYFNEDLTRKAQAADKNSAEIADDVS